MHALIKRGAARPRHCSACKRLLKQWELCDFPTGPGKTKPAIACCVPRAPCIANRTRMVSGPRQVVHAGRKVALMIISYCREIAGAREVAQAQADHYTIDADGIDANNAHLKARPPARHGANLGHHIFGDQGVQASVR